MPKPQLEFPCWVPKPARQVLQAELDARPDGASPAHRALIERLATSPQMETVWRKLPREPAHGPPRAATLQPAWRPLATPHGVIAYFALYYAQPEVLNALIAPRRSRSSEDAAYPGTKTPTLLALRRDANSARMLRDRARELYRTAPASWASAWNADPDVTPDKLFKILDVVAHLYERLIKPAEDLIRGTPQIGKRRGENARRNAYTLAVSSTVEIQFGRPCDEAVAALVEVVFDLPEGVSVEAVRSLRRRCTG